MVQSFRSNPHLTIFLLLGLMTIVTPSMGLQYLEPGNVIGFGGYLPQGDFGILTSDTSVNGAPLTLGSMSLSSGTPPKFAPGRTGNVWSGYLPWTNPLGGSGDLTFTVTQTASKIPIKMYITIDGVETTYAFGGANITRNFTVAEGATLQSIVLACYF